MLYGCFILNWWRVLIERPQNILHQFLMKKIPNSMFPNLSSGLKLMAWGLFQESSDCRQSGFLCESDLLWSSITTAAYRLSSGCIVFQSRSILRFSGYSRHCAPGRRCMGFKLAGKLLTGLIRQRLFPILEALAYFVINWFRDYLYIPLEETV